MRTTRVTGEMKPYLYLHTRHKTIEKSEKFEFWRGAIKGKKKKERRWQLIWIQQYIANSFCTRTT